MDANSMARTLSLKYHRRLGNTGFAGRRKAAPRRLIPHECVRLTGFPDSFNIRVSNIQTYQQFSQTTVVLIIIEAPCNMSPHITTKLSAIKKEENSVY